MRFNYYIFLGGGAAGGRAKPEFSTGGGMEGNRGWAPFSPPYFSPFYTIKGGFPPQVKVNNNN